MCWDNEDRKSRFMKDPFTDATHKKLIHRTSPMRTNNNDVYLQVRGLLQDCLYRCSVHKQGCCIHACRAHSVCNLLNLAMLAVEFLRKGFPGRQWIHFEFNVVRFRHSIMQQPHFCRECRGDFFDLFHNYFCGFGKVNTHQKFNICSPSVTPRSNKLHQV